MKIATCLTADGEVGTPFEANSICVFERKNKDWIKVRDFEYFPVPDMGINHARLLLQGIASRLTDCEVFLVGALQGFTHVWLEELGFRTWKSEGSLIEQLDNVAERDELVSALNRQTEQDAFDVQSSTGGCGSGCGGCHGRVYDSTKSQKDFEDGHPIPLPIPVGEIAERHFRLDLAAALELDPILNSRQIIIPFLEKKGFTVFDVHFSHLPKWFYHVMDQLSLQADIFESVAPAHGVDAHITPKT